MVNEVEEAKREYAARLAYKQHPWPPLHGGRTDKVAISVVQVLMEQTGWSLEKCKRAVVEGR